MLDQTLSLLSNTFIGEYLAQKIFILSQNNIIIFKDIIININNIRERQEQSYKWFLDFFLSYSFFLGFFGFLDLDFALQSGQIGAFLWICW